MKYGCDETIYILELLEHPEMLADFILPGMRVRLMQSLPLEIQRFDLSWSWCVDDRPRFIREMPTAEGLIEAYRYHSRRSFHRQSYEFAHIRLEAIGTESPPPSNFLSRSLYPTEERSRDRISIPRHSDSDYHLKQSIRDRFRGQAITPVLIAQMEEMWGGRVTVYSDGSVTFDDRATSLPTTNFNFWESGLGTRWQNNSITIPHSPEQRENQNRLNTCAFASGDPRLKCAVNPMEECRLCSHWEAIENGD